MERLRGVLRVLRVQFHHGVPLQLALSRRVEECQADVRAEEDRDGEGIRGTVTGVMVILGYRFDYIFRVF